ncbi:MAG: DUF2336 domain-containing protein [Rhodospirillaceae bacterium]|nr:DUF2336 domain-containing protein [Rhodospirillaceae bacterium]
MFQGTERYEDGTARRTDSPHASQAASLNSLIGALRVDDMDGARSALMTLSGLPDYAMERLWRTPSPEGLAVICRALDLRRPLFAALYSRLHGGHPYTDFARTAQFRSALIQFNRLHASQASRILDGWQRAPMTVWQDPDPAEGGEPVRKPHRRAAPAGRRRVRPAN